MIKRLLTTILFLAILLPVCSADVASGFTKHFNETPFVVTEKGQASIELLLDEKEYKIGKDIFGIVIHDTKDNDIEGAKVQVSLTSAEGTKEIAPVKEKGGGLYTFSSLEIPKEGAWKLNISVKKKKIDDSAVFAFPNAGRSVRPAGKYNREDISRK